MAAIAPIISFWYFKSFFLGAFGMLIINIAGSALYAGYIYGQTIYYPYIIEGIDIRDHFIYPALILIILMAAGSLKTKRDYI